MFLVSVNFYEISKTVSFVLLRVFNDGRFCSVASQFWWVTRSQSWWVLVGYEISMTVGFAGLRDFSDGFVGL